jgi:hypothetical protein
MAEKISWSLTVTVTGGPKFQDSRLVEVDAYDKVSVTVPGDPAGGANVVTVAVQPSVTASDVKFLYIRSSLYSTPDGAELTYENNGSTVSLDGPLLLTGGAVGLLASAPDALTFTNGFGLGSDAEVTILVGREAQS